MDGALQEMEKVGQKPYVIVYFHADTRLGAVPDTDFFSGVHSALLPCHRRTLKVDSPFQGNLAFRSHVMVSLAPWQWTCLIRSAPQQV
jgi:hypothetical protein